MTTEKPSKFKSSSKRNFIVYLTDFGLRIIVQLGYFIIIANSLGPAGYGVFASLTATTKFFSTFSGIGCDQVLLRRVAQDGTPFALAFGNALAAIALTIVPLLLLNFFVAEYLDLGQMSPVSVLGIIVSDILFNRSIWLANICFQAHEMAKQQLAINLSTSILKLVAAALAWYLSPELNIDQWAGWYTLSSATSMFIALGVVLATFGWPKAALYLKDFGDGALYALESASLTALRDLDKPVVAQTLGLSAAGFYTAAFRIVDTACVPIRALLSTTYTRYFHHGKSGPIKVIQFALRIVPIMIGLSLFLIVGLLIGAQFLSAILGAEYNGAIPVIHMLSLYPLLLGLSAVGSDILRAMGRQRERMVVTLFSTITYLPVIWLGATWYGTEGAALGRTITQVLVLASTGYIVFRVWRQTNKQAVPEANSS